MSMRPTLEIEPATVDLYPSRTTPEPRWLERRDPVIHGRPGHLTPEARQSYEENGFLSLPGFFTSEQVRVLQDEAEHLRRQAAANPGAEMITEPASREIRSIFEVHRSSPVIDRLARDRRLIAIVEELLGGGVYVHQSRINYKPGLRGKEFYWHSDFETWHVEDGMPRMRAVSCSVALTENFPWNGPLMLIPGSHKVFVGCVGATPENHYQASLKKQEYGVPDDQSLHQLAEAGGIAAPTGPAGSVTLFDCNVLHGSSSNIAPFPRTNVFLVYNSVENRLQDPFCGLGPRPRFIADRSEAPALRPV